ncbi:MAG: hypothetical protein ABII18_13435 [bacterium]|nr:hypothetical protein [bacterium]MBU1916998.1 hypothetical protein [bacterium]
MKKLFFIFLVLALVFISAQSFAKGQQNSYDLPESYYNSLRTEQKLNNQNDTTNRSGLRAVAQDSDVSNTSNWRSKNQKTTKPLATDTTVQEEPLSDSVTTVDASVVSHTEAPTADVQPAVAQETPKEEPKKPAPNKKKRARKSYPSYDQSSKYNLSYITTAVGALRQEIEEMKKGLGKDKTAGYDGGFFIRNEENTFKMSINGKLQVRYSFNIAEDFEDGHTFVIRRANISFSGHAFTEKLGYFLLFNLGGANSLLVADLSYDFHKAFGVHLGRMGLSVTNIQDDSSSKLMFVTAPLAASRFDSVGLPVQILFSGAIDFFSYNFTITNGLGTSYDGNLNNEMAYAARFDFRVVGEMSSGQGDYANSEKPAFTVGLGGVYGHEDTGSQTRHIVAAGDFRFKYKGFALLGAGYYRQQDPDMFTRAQTDIGAELMAGYFLIPQKLELAIRGAALFDDITDSGLNLGLATDGDTRLNDPSLGGGDVDGDAFNEYEGSIAMGYYFEGFNVKIQAQYSFFLDGIAGPDDRIYHVGMLQLHMHF